MISTGELRKGVAIELDGELWQILDYHHIKMGAVRPRSGSRCATSSVARPSSAASRPARNGPGADGPPPGPVPVPRRRRLPFHGHRHLRPVQAQRGPARGCRPLLKDGMLLERTSYQDETIGVELPVTVDLVVAETEPGFAGTPRPAPAKARHDRIWLVVTVPDLRQRRRHRSGSTPGPASTRPGSEPAPMSRRDPPSGALAATSRPTGRCPRGTRCRSRTPCADARRRASPGPGHPPCPEPAPASTPALGQPPGAEPDPGRAQATISA